MFSCAMDRISKAIGKERSRPLERSGERASNMSNGWPVENAVEALEKDQDIGTVSVFAIEPRLPFCRYVRSSLIAEP